MPKLIGSAILVILFLADCASAQVQAPATHTPAQIDLTPDANGRLSDRQIRELLRSVAEKDLYNDTKRRDYTYIQRKEEHRLDRDGRVKSTETETSEVLIIYDEQVLRRLAKNDKPLPAKEAAKEEQRIQRIIDKRKNESEGDRKKRLQKEKERGEQGRKFVLEIADAYNFHFAGVEQLDARDTYVIDAEPRAGYKPRLKEAKFLPKFRFRAWIDKQDYQLAKLDALCIDTISFGVFLARLNEGSHAIIEQMRVNDEIWLPRHVGVKLNARVALLKKYNLDQDYTYRDYKKFRTETKILGGQEVKQ